MLIKVSNQNGSNGYYRLTWLVVLAIQAFLMRDEESYRLLPLLHPPLSPRCKLLLLCCEAAGSRCL